MKPRKADIEAHHRLVLKKLDVGLTDEEQAEHEEVLDRISQALGPMADMNVIDEIRDRLKASADFVDGLCKKYGIGIQP